jgi:hypothetical protein
MAAFNRYIRKANNAPHHYVSKTLQFPNDRGSTLCAQYCPKPIMAVIAAALFWPTLWWNQLMKSKKKGAVQRNWWHDHSHDFASH